MANGYLDFRVEVKRARLDYQLGELDETHAAVDPFEQFERWFADAVRAGLREPNAMVLATVNKEQQPTARTILLKQFDRRGFVFFGSYLSRKGHDLWDNPKAALLSLWLDLERQIRIEGEVVRIEASESEEYFETRPRGAKVGAIASPQSRVISGRSELEALFEKVGKQAELKRPETWGGFRLQPKYFEFWQGRENRLHDRLCYEFVTGQWVRRRLAP